MNSRVTLIVAGIAGATGVALGAFGAHGLKALLIEKGTSVSWETAARYHLLHALALFGLGIFQAQLGPRAATLGRLIAWCWTGGILIFCGSLYLLAVLGLRWLGPITPIGGLAFILGWLLLIPAALKKD